jgi:8-oxo-dGTP pyrophosphatase MutT (NUDIX family)
MNSFSNDPKPWKQISSEYLFRKPWLTMRQDCVEMPNGSRIDEFFVWEYPEWVNVVALTPKKEVVLIRQFRYAINKVFYEIPAGVHDNPNETLLEAAQRELLEETGYGGGQWQEYMQLSANPALQNNITYTFLAENVEKLKPQALEETEEIVVHKMPLEHLQDMLLSGQMIQALHTAPLLKYLLSHT